MPLAELKRPHLTLPDQPDLIPYRTSYYAEIGASAWRIASSKPWPMANYEVVIDSKLADGALTYGEYLHRGRVNDEMLLSAHVCHPSLANDNCAGLALLAHLANRLRRARDTTQLPLPVRARHDRRHHLARPQ